MSRESVSVDGGECFGKGAEVKSAKALWLADVSPNKVLTGCFAYNSKNRSDHQFNLRKRQWSHNLVVLRNRYRDKRPVKGREKRKATLNDIHHPVFVDAG